MADTKAAAEAAEAAPLSQGVDPNDMPLTRVSDIIDDPSKWSDYPQLELDDIVGRDIVLQDCMIFPSQEWEGREWAIVLFTDAVSGDYMTTSTGGDVAMRKLHQLKDAGTFPIIGKFTKRASRTKGQSDYVDLS